MKEDTNYKPKEKAIKLMSMFVMYTQTFYENDISFAKNCALITVDEILSVIHPTPYNVYYWREVKKEIEKL